MSQESGMIEEFDNIRTMQLNGSIRVLDKECLPIRFKDGTESVQYLKRETPSNEVIHLPDSKTPKRQ